MTLAINAIIGAICGLMINYLADVLPATRSFSRPVCKSCAQPFSLKDYLINLRCSHCGSRISKRYLLVPVSAGLACVLLTYFPLVDLGFWASLPLLIFLGVILVIDIEYHAVLFETSLFGFVLLSIYGLLINGFQRTFTGALAGLLIMLAFYFIGLIFARLVGAVRHKQIDEVVFGFGDVCLGLNLGLLTGWPLIIGAITIAILAFETFTLIFFMALLVSKKYRAFASALPFTPFLILGALAIFYI